jgi:hypothetical protein
MMRHTWQKLSLFAFLFGCFCTSSFADKVFQAGAATSNITPPLGQLVVGGWKPYPAQHIHDELHARCIVLDDGKTKLAIVVCDNLGLPRQVVDLAKEQAHKATGIPKSHMLFSATHTHSASTARGPKHVFWNDEITDYQKFLANRISDCVRRALNQLEPAKIGWGTVDEASEVNNRRWYVTDPKLLANPFGGIDKVRMNPPRGNKALVRPAGPIDPQVSFISVQSKDGRPIALLANYSLHYVGGVNRGDVSADYFGYFANFIEAKLGAKDQERPFVGIMSNGTSGDINNINFVKKTRRYERYEKMQEVALKVASKVYEAHKVIEFQDWVELGARQVDLPVKLRKPTPEILAHFKKLDPNADKSSWLAAREHIYAERIAKLKDAPESFRVSLQALKIGDLGIAAIPFETFVEIGLEIKQKSPFKHSFTIELANGYYGYLPTPEQHKLGGYETWLGTNYVEFEASTKITKKLLELLEDFGKQ